MFNFSLLSQEKLHFNPIRPGGGGGLKGMYDQTHSCQSETSYSMMPKPGDFQFLFLKTCSDQILAKLINQDGLVLLFSHRDVPKILKMKKFSSA